MARGQSAEAAQGSVARLVEAERTWQQALDAARAEADASAAAAVADARAREHDADIEVDAEVDAMRRALEADATRAAAAEGAAIAGAGERFAGVTDAFVDALADAILDESPWFARDTAPMTPPAALPRPAAPAEAAA